MLPGDISVLESNGGKMYRPGLKQSWQNISQSCISFEVKMKKIVVTSSHGCVRIWHRILLVLKSSSSRLRLHFQNSKKIVNESG
jgi:hypothetical protein